MYFTFLFWVIFFSLKQSSNYWFLKLTGTHHFKSKHVHWRISHQKSYKQKKSNKNPPFWKFLLNSLLSGSSSCVKLFIFNILAMKLFIFNILAIRLFIVIVKEIKLFIFAIFFNPTTPKPTHEVDYKVSFIWKASPS